MRLERLVKKSQVDAACSCIAIVAVTCPIDSIPVLLDQELQSQYRWNEVVGLQVCTHLVHGKLTLETTNDFGPTLAGELCGFFSSLVLCFVISWAFPESPYDWEGTRSIQVLDDADAKVNIGMGWLFKSKQVVAAWNMCLVTPTDVDFLRVEL